MKKSLVILTLILAVAVTETHAKCGERSGDRHSNHSSSLNESSVTGSSDIMAFAGYSTVLFDGNSPSSRKNNHWLRQRNSMDERTLPEEPVQKRVPVRPAFFRKWQQKPKRKLRKQEVPESQSPKFFADCTEKMDGRDDVQYTSANQELNQLVKWIAESGLY